ncbi:hypothetical protein EK0264_09640 [Epidermidibacterium keratini]|uniref:Tetratricopeptide repeat protein n=1 Tax=Epidermidibacterium keratini TaxID=1891644 RepID=A0A7L4YNY1_9ACTN|nr:hypothetical protein [Epidermidibacterium keratini]QHC00519.1 hypothetical protein EK0264_09640 [Epidermidibacterium keratini]
MPIPYADPPAALSEQIEAVYDKLVIATNLTSGPEMEAAAQTVYDEAVELDYPHLMALAAMVRMGSEFDRNEWQDGVASYARLLKLGRQYAEFIAPELSAQIIDLAPYTVNGMLQLPRASLPQITGLIDRLEQAHLAAGEPLGQIYLSRALVAAHRGDGEAVREWQERWQADPAQSTPAMTARMNVYLSSTYDRARAVEYAEYAAAEINATSAAWLAGERALLLVQTGRPDAASAAARTLVTEADPDVLASAVDFGSLLRALETDRDTALEVMAMRADLFEPDAPPDEFLAQASAARLLLADPATAARGAALCDLAMRNAGAFDERNETSYNTDLLRAEWFNAPPYSPDPSQPMSMKE